MSSLEDVAQLPLGEEALDALLPVLARVREESHARAVLLIDSGGRLLGEVGETSDLDITTLGPLAASSVAATSSMAQLLGEKEFTVLFHQGERDSVQLTLVEEGLILAVFFGRGASLGLVRLRLRKASAEVREILHRTRKSASRPEWWISDPPGEITVQDIEDLFTF